MRTVTVNLDERSYDVVVGRDLLARAAVIPGSTGPGRAFLVVDRRAGAVADRLEGQLGAAGWAVRQWRFTVGEALKDPARVVDLQGRLIRAGADRDAVVFAVGGGVVGDLAGFVAATYLRGVRWVGVPTTLLAQVDSSIGGKTGVNHPLGKNLVGAFHQPSLVVSDLSALDTLPDRELASGLGEVAKTALLEPADAFPRWEGRWGDLLARDAAALEESVAACAAFKARLVAGDELDRRGLREALNLGHTVGHALEAATGFGRFRHGEAVLWGLRAALALSEARGHLAASTRSRLDAFVARTPVPAWPRDLEPRKLLPYLRRDKKRSNGRVRFVLLHDVGHPVADAGVTEREIVAALATIR